MKNSKQCRLREAYYALGQSMAPAEISIQKLVEKAGISRSTFYAYYTNLLDFTLSLETELLSPLTLLPAGGAVSWDTLRAALCSALQYCFDNAGKFHLLRYAPQSRLLPKLKRILENDFDFFVRKMRLQPTAFQRFTVLCTLASIIIPSTIHIEATAAQMAADLTQMLQHLLQPNAPSCTADA